MLRMMQVMCLIFCSCSTVSVHKIAYQVDPKQNALCQLIDKYGKRLEVPICFTVNSKDNSGEYKFLKHGGYIAISLQAAREVLLKGEEK